MTKLSFCSSASALFCEIVNIWFGTIWRELDGFAWVIGICGVIALKLCTQSLSCMMVMMIGSLHSTINRSPRPQKPRNNQTIAMSPFPVSHCQLADLFCILYFRTIVRSVPSFYGRLFYEGVGKSMAPHIENNTNPLDLLSIALLLGSMYFCSWLPENEVHKSWWQPRKIVCFFFYKIIHNLCQNA